MGRLNLELLEDRRGPLRIVRPPEEGHFYAMGVDSSEGQRGGDPSAICVIDMVDMEQVAWWHGYVEPRVLGRKSAWLGWHYNEAFAVVESNNTGQAVVYEMKDLAYPNMYRRTAYDEVTRSYSRTLGFRTDVKTRSWLWSLGRMTMNEGWGRINSKAQIAEMSYLNYDERDIVVHPKGGHDDEVIAWLLALVGRDQAFQERMVPEPPKPALDYSDRHWESFDRELGISDDDEDDIQL